MHIDKHRLVQRMLSMAGRHAAVISEVSGAMVAPGHEYAMWAGRLSQAAYYADNMNGLVGRVVCNYRRPCDIWLVTYEQGDYLLVGDVEDPHSVRSLAATLRPIVDMSAEDAKPFYQRIASVVHLNELDWLERTGILSYGDELMIDDDSDDDAQLTEYVVKEIEADIANAQRIIRGLASEVLAGTLAPRKTRVVLNQMLDAIELLSELRPFHSVDDSLSEIPF